MTNMLSDIITYIRRIIKTPSNASITDNLIIDYINRFWIMDVDARLQLFDLKTTYQFQTTPGIDKYNMPLYSVQTQSTGGASVNIGPLPVYQNFLGPCFINGIEMPFYTEREQFYNVWPNYNQMFLQVGTGNGTAGPYTFNFPFISNTNTNPQGVNTGIIRGHVDMQGVMATMNPSISLPQTNDPPLDTIGNGYLIPVIPTTSSLGGIFFTTIGQNGASAIVQDTGIFLNVSGNSFQGLLPNQVFGELTSPGPAPYGNAILSGGYYNSFSITNVTNANPCVITTNNNFSVGQTVTISGVGGTTQLNGNTYTITAAGPTSISINVDSTNFGVYTSGGFATSFANVVNYLNGVAYNVFFPQVIPNGNPITGQCVFYQTGIPRAVLFYNNTLVFRAPPNTSYLIELNAYLTPAAFFNTANFIPFGYMAEYIARGAARKILSDVGDVEQFNFYEPFFKEQELLVWKRSQRQWTATRTPTIYSQIGFPNTYNQSSFGV